MADPDSGKEDLSIESADRMCENEMSDLDDDSSGFAWY